MSHGTNPTVECPLCGTSFDPSDAGGWCTNSDCGDWQYEGGDAGDLADDPETGEQTDDEHIDADEQTAADEQTSANERTDASEPATDGSDGNGTADPNLSCPACGTDVEATDNFCRTCGTDVSHVEPGSAELTACPECDADVEHDDRFCRICGENLDVYRPDASVTGDSAGGAGASANGSAPRAEAAPTGDAGPTNADRSASDGDGQAEPSDGPRLALVVRNREIQVRDGDTVGRKIRSIIMDTGGDEEDAVRVHREHVRFERDDDQFHLVDLGRNPTIVNGDRLDEGDRVPVSPGDRIELSGIAHIQVQET